MSKQIPLSNGQVALVDDWHYEELNRWNWHARWSENTQSFYAVRNVGKKPFRTTMLMHRQIMNTPKGMLCDHRNHDTLDNQEHNLRNVTYSQNGMNSRVSSNNKIGQKCIRPYRKGYRVKVVKDGKQVFCKDFHTIDEAITARDAALQRFHGEYAYQGQR